MWGKLEKLLQAKLKRCKPVLQGDGGHIFISLNSPNHVFVLNPVVLKPTINIPVISSALKKGAVTLT